MAAPAAPLDPSFPGRPITLQTRLGYLTWPELEAALGEEAWRFWQDSLRFGRTRYNHEQKMLDVEIQYVVTAATHPAPAWTAGGRRWWVRARLPERVEASIGLSAANRRTWDGAKVGQR